MKTSKIDKLKSIKEMSLLDFNNEEGLFWLIKNILIEYEDRINQLEFQVAQLKGEVEEDENI